MEHIEVWVAMATLFLTFLGLFWRTASIYGDMKYQIKRNYDDINRMGNSLREEIKRRDQVLMFFIVDMQSHLNETDNYRAPSLRIEDD